MSLKAKGPIAGILGLFAAGLTHSVIGGWGTVMTRALVSGAVAAATVGIILFALRNR
jgi:hypothetical protein